MKKFFYNVKLFLILSLFCYTSVNGNLKIKSEPAVNFAFRDYTSKDFAEIANVAAKKIRELLIKDPVVQERWVVCAAPFLCQMKGGASYYFDFASKKCVKQTDIKRIVNFLNQKKTPKPIVGMTKLYALCGSGVIPSQADDYYDDQPVKELWDSKTDH